MKKNDWLLLSSVLLYSFLFYHQFAGINFLLFNLALLLCLLLKKPESLKDKSWLVAAGAAVVSSACIAYYSSSLAIVANLIALALVSFFSIAPRSSVILALCMSIISIGSSCVYMFLDWMKRNKAGKEGRSKPFYVIILMFVFISIITILFFLMYQSSNPLFKDFTKNISLDFISISWMIFTLGGLLLLYGFYYVRRINYFSEPDEHAPDTITEQRANEDVFLNRLFKADTEYLTGSILFVILNAMLLLLNILDLNYLWFDGKLPDEVDHKEFVHNGIGMLITSILFAILIILFYFRGRLNFHSKAKYLRWLACFWIIQNAFMIFSSAYRTNMYIAEFGISYKKIGVYVYLGLTLIGLITTYIKVTKLKSNWYLVRVNTWCYFGILTLSCLFNWDAIITNFNISKALTEHKKLEKYYLLDLSFKNLPQLLMLNDSIKNNDDFGVRDYYFSSRGTYFFDFKTGLDNKLFAFLTEVYKAGWQSWCFEKSRVYAEILKLNSENKIKSVDLSRYSFATSLEPLKILSAIETLDFSQHSLNKIEELAYFPKLKKLNLSSNYIDSLDRFPVLSDLEVLNVSNNPITEISGLSRASRLRELNLTKTNLTDINDLPDFQRLETLNLTDNRINDFNALSKYRNLSSLYIRNTLQGSTTEFPELRKLTVLDLSKNQISRNTDNYFFTKLNSCRNIKTLYLGENYLETLEALLYGAETERYKNADSVNFPLLEELDLATNGLYSVKGINKYNHLHNLDLSNNKLVGVSEIFELNELKTLRLNNNPIRSIDGIENLAGLETLAVSGCTIEKGLPLLAKLKTLRVLEVRGNAIKTIDTFTGLTRLRNLDLSGNLIKTLNGIEKLSGLEELNLRGNSITDYSSLYSLKHLKTLYVEPMTRPNLLKLKKALPNCTVYDYDPSPGYRDL